MYQLPLESMATLEGEESWAAMAGPLSPPKFGDAPLPAMVVTMLPPAGISMTKTPLVV
jgi:hypothetical protein